MILSDLMMPTRDNRLREALKNVVRPRGTPEHAPWELSPMVGEDAHEHEDETEPRTPLCAPCWGKRVTARHVCVSALVACSALAFFAPWHGPVHGAVDGAEGRGLDGCFALGEDLAAREEQDVGMEACVDVQAQICAGTGA